MVFQLTPFLATEFPLWVKIIAFVPGAIILVYLAAVIWMGVHEDDK
jgi:hypothetical protein